MNIEKISITPLKRISTNGGDVLRALKSDETDYCGFGEAYFSQISFGSIKAWKRHTRMTMNIIVPVGNVKFVFNESDIIKVVEIGINNYSRITVPPGVWFGFQGLYEMSSLVLNIANIIHDANEIERLDINDIKYDWMAL